MFRITYEQGNGYNCGCCRRTWTETTDLDSEQEVIQWLSELEADKTISSYEDSDDRRVTDIREIKDEELCILADPTLVQKIIDERKIAKEKEKQRVQKAEERAKVTADKKRLKELKEKYPEV